MYDIINTGLHLPNDRNFIVLTHSDENEGKLEACTILKYIIFRGYSKYFLNIYNLSFISNYGKCWIIENI